MRSLPFFVEMRHVVLLAVCFQSNVAVRTDAISVNLVRSLDEIGGLRAYYAGVC